MVTGHIFSPQNAASALPEVAACHAQDLYRLISSASTVLVINPPISGETGTPLCSCFAAHGAGAPSAISRGCKKMEQEFPCGVFSESFRLQSFAMHQ